MRARTIAFLAVMPALFLAPAGARAQPDSREGIELQNQIAELRQQIQTLQSSQQYAAPQPYAGAQPYAGQQQNAGQPGAGQGGGDTAAELVVRVGALEEQNRALQGRVDNLTNQLQRQHDELAKQISDLSFKFGQGGKLGQDQGVAPGQSAAEAAPSREPAAAASPHRTAELALREGNLALSRHDYPAAATAAREALASGHGMTATSAQFLLARAEGAQHEYKQAAADFYQAYNHAPRSPTAPVALLGVANALIAMGDARDACQALAKLTTEFPGGGSVKAGVVSARKRAACTR